MITETKGQNSRLTLLTYLLTYLLCSVFMRPLGEYVAMTLVARTQCHYETIQSLARNNCDRSI